MVGESVGYWVAEKADSTAAVMDLAREKTMAALTAALMVVMKVRLSVEMKVVT